MLICEHLIDCEQHAVGINIRQRLVKICATLTKGLRADAQQCLGQNTGSTGLSKHHHTAQRSLVE